MGRGRAQVYKFYLIFMNLPIFTYNKSIFLFIYFC